ncbi:hypothetical protein BOTBODRAFT_26437 [Botryobasidium botryosum FD-172 SS1]|uniref:BTB domain-containing protein n=1 Tax=Botryobasidium botryosum (strain FD-172 SS1) TaxID=930990 RepID=A0A067N0G2_BOTB1|nr:hypothetical protein BOTBODRAFT_26437 [Botryobasidium botryosum FD-172 SS1]
MPARLSTWRSSSFVRPVNPASMQSPPPSPSTDRFAVAPARGKRMRSESPTPHDEPEETRRVKCARPRGSRLRASPAFPPAEGKDLILRGSNTLLEFHADRQTVCDASPVLRSMISALGEREPGTIEIVQVEETEEILEAMLRFIYPKTRKPMLSSVEQLEQLLRAAKKYRIEAAFHTLGAAVLDLAQKEPLRAYAISCRHGLVEEMRLTSSHTLRVDILKSDLSHEVGDVKPVFMKKLVQLHNSRASQALKVILEAGTEEFTCKGEYCEDGVAEWWMEVMKRSRGELKSRPTSETIFNPAFLASCVRTAGKRCGECASNYLSLKAQHKLAVLKDAVDALPATI